MNTPKIFLWCTVILCTLLISCNDEEKALTPSGIESGYKVPQGNHSYDSEIVDFYNKYGSCLLYEFTGKDTYWTPSGWKNGTVGLFSDGGKIGYLAFQADTVYVDKQLKLLNRLWFRFYSDTFLKKFLPVKIFLCSSVQNCNFDFSSGQLMISGFEIPSYYNYDNICVSYASSVIDTLTDSLSVAKSINRHFVESMIGRSLISPTTAFTNAVSYDNISTIYTNTGLWNRGILSPSYSASSTSDWEDFMYMMVTYPESYLTRTPVTDTGEYDYTETAWDGILNSAKDTNGLLRERYDMVRNYFIDNYGTDLQAIGNAINNY